MEGEDLIRHPTYLIPLLAILAILFWPIVIADEVLSYGSKVNSGDIDEGRDTNDFLPPNSLPAFVFVDANQPPGIGPGDPVRGRHQNNAI